ncbi:MAG: LysR family transcriptional regulator [Clostridiales bacterium]|nr:LysR family transcriptional regulator [Clostridiales bacterium]
MELRTMRYFLAVAREENMTKAAEILHVTQPTLSKALKALEDELGKKLFERHSFSISLTEEGVLLRNRAEDLVTMADKIEKEFLALDDITGGNLYFGLAESYQIRYLARMISKFKMICPGLQYHITSGDTEQVTERMDKGLLDFAVLCDLPDTRKYHFIELPEGDIWGVVIPADAPLAKKSAVSVKDLEGLPLFTSVQAWEGDIKRWAGESYGKLNLEGSFRLAYNASLFVMEGLGYQLTFEKLVDTSPESGLVFRPLAPRLETKLYLIWNKYQTFTPVAERFLTEVKKDFEYGEKSNNGKYHTAEEILPEK